MIILLNAAEVVGIVFHLFLFLALEGTHAFEHLVPVNEGSVKLRSVDAHELCLSAYGESASSTHTGTVHHDGVERHVCRDVIFLSEQATELHHYWRSDGKDSVDVFLLYEFFNTYGHYSLFSVRAVVGHDDEFVATVSHFIFKDYEVARASCDDREHTVTGSFQCPDDRQHRSHSHSTSGTNHGTEVFDVCRIAKWSHHVSYVVTFIE